MTTRKLCGVLLLSGMCVALAVPAAFAAPKEKKNKAGAVAPAPKAKAKKGQVVEAAPVAPLTETGEKLQAQYAATLEAVKGEISQALPQIDEQKKANLLKALDAEKAAVDNLDEKHKALSENRSFEGLLKHHQGWLAKATKGVADAKAALKQAEAISGSAEEKAKAVKDAQEALAKIQENYELAVKEVKKVEENVTKAKPQEPALIKAVEEAEAALAQARAVTQKAFDELGLRSFLASDKLDAKLAKFEVLAAGTPRGLAEFAEKGKEQEALIGKLLADDSLMKQMVANDGAAGGKYGRAMEIYAAIQKASPKANDGLFQRLALAVALEHAVPMKQGNPAAATNAPVVVDPVQRYLNYEKAYLAGELDVGFKGLDVWELRMVVDGDEPPEISDWGRAMLRNYRPDHISTPDTRWRYVKAVKTDVKYGSAEQKNDLPTCQNYQNMINTGGVCGRRAFFGRFILRVFGIPVVARPQKGHAALAHWTPNGWVINLGAGWGAGKGVGQYPTDLDFLAMTQARAVESTFLEVQRAQWIGDVLGEARAYGLIGKGAAYGSWNIAAQCRQRQIIADAKAKTLEAVGQDIAEANVSKEVDIVEKVEITDADKRIDVAPNNVITIPAAAFSLSTNAATVVFMKSNLGGLQMHYNRVGPATTLSFTVEAPKAGKFALSARVVTVSPNQSVLVSVNDAQAPVTITLPYTIGMWQKTGPVEIDLVQGKNVLKFDRPAERRGLTIRDFTITPVK